MKRSAKLWGRVKKEREHAFSFSEATISSIVEAGGGRYVGVQTEIHTDMESVVLFISPRTKTTLGIPISRLTVRAVCEQLAESDAAFSEADLE